MNLKDVAANYGIPEDLRQLSDKDLTDLIRYWEGIETKVLSCLCAEALRRLFREKQDSSIG